MAELDLSSQSIIIKCNGCDKNCSKYKSNDFKILYDGSFGCPKGKKIEINKIIKINYKNGNENVLNPILNALKTKKNDYIEEIRKLDYCFNMSYNLFNRYLLEVQTNNSESCLSYIRKAIEYCKRSILEYNNPYSVALMYLYGKSGNLSENNKRFPFDLIEYKNIFKENESGVYKYDIIYKYLNELDDNNDMTDKDLKIYLNNLNTVFSNKDVIMSIIYLKGEYELDLLEKYIKIFDIYLIFKKNGIKQLIKIDLDVINENSGDNHKLYYVPIINNEFYTIFMEKDNSFKIKKRINKLCNKYKNKNDSLNNRVRDLITDLISTVSPSDDDTNLKICYLRKIDFRYTKKIKDK